MTQGIIKINIREIPAYQNARERQLQLVKENPFIEVTDTKTYDEAKKRRTNLRKGRYELQNGEKIIASKIKEFRNYVKSETEKLIAITLPHEEKQQSEVERYEEAKRREKEERERLERERIEKLKAIIINFRQEKQSQILKATIDTVDEVEASIIEFEADVEEFQNDLSLVKEQLLETLQNKREQLEEAECMRLEKERLEAEKKRLEQERKEQEAKMKAEREEMEKKLREQKEEMEKQRREIERAEAEKKAREEAERKAKEYRENLINEVQTIYPENIRKQTEQLTNEELERVIKKYHEDQEKARKEALKSDKEKLLTIVKSLRFDYNPEIEIKDKQVNKLLVNFTEEADLLMKKYITLINNL